MSIKPRKYYLTAAHKAGIQITEGQKHTKMRAIDPETGRPSMMILPHGEIKGRGTEFAIRKWLLKMGVVLSLLFLITRLV